MLVAAPGQTECERARRAAIHWAASVVADPRAVYLDTETTGLDGGAEIIEVAVIDGLGRTLLDTPVRPDGAIPRDATRVHGIVGTMVAGAPRWDVVYPRVAALLRDRTVIVYNAAYDLRLVNQMNRRFGYAPPPSGWHCAMLRYAAYVAIWNSRFGNFRWHKLEAALADFGHAPAGHRAAADAQACRLVVQGMAATG